MRQVHRQYEDPLELIWLVTAARLGLRVVRDNEVFASWDGQGTLRVGTAETLDEDDSLAQMIFHEICHALVEGPAAFHLPDWGLDITDPVQRVREHACLRLQAALATPHGLRGFFAATTAARKYYDKLPHDPLAELKGQADDPAIAPAKEGWERAVTGLWAADVRSALRATAEIARATSDFAQSGSLWHTSPSDASTTHHPASISVL